MNMKNNANLVQARIDRAIKEEGDYYATHPSMVERFISRVSEKYELGRILEPACGGEPYLSDIYILRGREGCGKNGDFSAVLRAINYAWFVFRKDFTGIKEVHII